MKVVVEKNSAAETATRPENWRGNSEMFSGRRSETATVSVIIQYWGSTIPLVTHQMVKYRSFAALAFPVIECC